MPRFPQFLLAALCASAVCAQAHGPWHEQIAALNSALSERPGDLDLLLRRAELSRMHEDWDLAASDIAAAAQAGAPKSALALARARLAVSRKQWDAAAEELPALAADWSHDGNVWRLVASIHLGRGERDRAVAALRETIAKARPHSPDDFSQLAGLLAGSGRAEEAIEVLDGALRSIGPISSLVEAAARLELDLKRTDAALGRFDAAAARTANPAYWLARKAEAAEQAGRLETATEARKAAIAALENLPEVRRRTVAMAELEGRLRASVDRSQAGKK
jgi:predicted Zn-dependent protease